MGFKVKKLGQYKVRGIPLAKGEKLTVGKAGTGSEQIGLTLVAVSEGPHQNEQHPWYGAMNNDENYMRTIKQLQLMGARCKEGDFRDMEGFGKIVEATSMLEESTNEENGEIQVRWSFVNKIGRAHV